MNKGTFVLASVLIFTTIFSYTFYIIEGVFKAPSTNQIILNSISFFTPQAAFSVIALFVTGGGGQGMELASREDPFWRCININHEHKSDSVRPWSSYMKSPLSVMDTNEFGVRVLYPTCPECHAIQPIIDPIRVPMKEFLKDVPPNLLKNMKRSEEV